MSGQTVRTAYQLIKSGQKAEAASQLRNLLDHEPDNADAWWLLAMASTEPADIRRALEFDLQLRPDHEAAQKALAALNRKYPPPAAEESDDFDALFPAEYVAAPRASQSTKAAQPAKKKNDQAWLLYGTIAVGVLFVCTICYALVRETTRAVTEVVSSEEFAGLQAIVAEAAAYQTVPEDANREGNISVGETKPERVDTFIDDVWTFAGRPGQRVTIRLEARDETLDPQLFLYDPDGYLIAANDDRIPEYDFNAEIQMVLTAEGRHTIVVSAFGEGGAYTLYLD